MLGNFWTAYAVGPLEALKNYPSAFCSSYEEEKITAGEIYLSSLQLDNSDNIILGAFVEGELVGIAGVYRGNKIKTRHKAELWGVYVKPAYSKKGIGKLLIENAISYAKNSLKCEVLNLCVETSNIPAIKLYGSLGFKSWGVEPKAVLVNNQIFDHNHMFLFLK